jgi:hypothetical protein
MSETGYGSGLKKSHEPGGGDRRIRQAEVVRFGEAADRAGGDEPGGVGGGPVSSGRRAAKSVLLVEEATAGSAGKIFDAKSGRPSAVETKTAAAVARFKDVIAEITAENLELKKGSRIRGSRSVAATVAA